MYITTSLRLIRINPKDPLLPELRRYMRERFPDYRRCPYLSRLSKQYRLTFRLLECRAVPLLSLLTRIKDFKNQKKA